jgi:hypothetical protein
MTLPASGAISFSNIDTELSLSSTAQISLNCSNVRGLFGQASGAICMNTGHNKSSFNPTVTSLLNYGCGSTFILHPYCTTYGGYNGSFHPTTAAPAGSTIVVVALGAFNAGGGPACHMGTLSDTAGNSYTTAFQNNVCIGVAAQVGQLSVYYKTNATALPTTGWWNVSSTQLQGGGFAAAIAISGGGFTNTYDSGTLSYAQSYHGGSGCNYSGSTIGTGSKELQLLVLAGGTYYGNPYSCQGPSCSNWTLGGKASSGPSCYFMKLWLGYKVSACSVAYSTNMQRTHQSGSSGYNGLAKVSLGFK